VSDHRKLTIVVNETRIVPELSWKEGELPQYLRTKHVHGIHPYLGKYIPQLVEYFLDKYFNGPQSARSAILDPFAGSGTTLVESNVKGKPSVGIDVSKFNVLLTRVKTSKYDVQDLSKEVHSIVSRTNIEVESKFSGALDHFIGGKLETKIIGTDESEYLKKWYDPVALAPLLIFRDLIAEYSYQDFLKVLLSRAARSARLAPHFELDFPKKPQLVDYECFKHHRICHPTTRSMPFLKRYALDMLQRARDFERIRTNAEVRIDWGDARTFDYETARIGGVITSPPYVGLIDYHEQHRYSYELLGLSDRSESEIGRKSAGGSKHAVRNYVSDMSLALKCVADHGLEDPGLLVIVVNDKLGLYEEIASKASLRISDRYRRRVDRRTGRRSNGFFEDIIVLTT